MFSKRRRAASNPPPRAAPPPSTSASLAATKAFVKNQASDATLSNAAAAAALRSHTSSPTPVGELVTKRMARRGSTSSQGSQRPQGLHRQSSTGSMTERSFRNPSPNGGNAAVPPVPAVPQNIPGSGGSVHRRASSLEPASRGASPTQRGGGRGVSLDRGPGPSAHRPQRVGSPLAQVSEEGHDQRQSVNFSRPMSPGLSGGPSSSSGWFGGPVVNQEAVQRMASTGRPKSVGAPYATNTAQAVANAAGRPVSLHYVQGGQEGMRLSSGGMRAKPSGTAVQSRSFLPASTQSPRQVDPKSPDAVYDPSTRTFIHKQDAMNIHREQHEQPEEPAQHYVSQHLRSAAPLQSGRGRTPSPLRHSVRPEQSPPRSVAQPLLPKTDAAETRKFEDRPVTPPSSQPSSSGATVARQHSKDYANADIEPVAFIPIDKGGANTAQQPQTELSSQFVQTLDSSYPRIGTPAKTASNIPVEQVRDTVKTERQASLSPARHATFAPNTSVLAGLKHEPLPRSVSPAKSALKSSPSVSRRSNSPLGPNQRVYSKAASVSGASDTASESGYGKKKKTVRVSFEQEPTVAGYAAYGDMDTPVSPAGPKPSKPTPAVQEEFDDFMKPRPALPSFGSVRDKTRQRDEEDIPQKVTETVSTPMSASVASVGDSMEASTDLGLGHTVAQDFASKQSATDDPLPPQATSVEGSGYVSDSNYSTDGESSVRKHADPITTETLPVREPKSLTKPTAETPSTIPAISEQIAEVPNIAVLPATPSPYEHPEPKFQSMSAPGGWTEEEEQQPPTTSYAAVQFAPIETPASIQQQQQLNEPPSTTNPDDDDTDNSSVYSDAYEDISDKDGGFGSINAIVESPVAGPSPGLMASKWADKSVTESPTPRSKSNTSTVDKDKLVDTSTSEWEAARAHWSGINRPRDHDDRPAVQTDTHRQTVAARVLQAPVQEAELRTERKPAVQASPKAAPQTTPQVSMLEAPSRASMSSQPLQTPNKPLKSALKKTTPSPAPAQTPGSGVPKMRMSMRSASPRAASSGQSQMRTTMRGNASPGPRAASQIRTSMRGDAAPATNMALAASRQSAPVDTKAPRGALQKKHIPAAVAASQARPQSIPAAAPRKQMAAPAPTYDSDSDASASSFHRSRARRNSGGGFSRTSMRGGPAGHTMRASAPAPAQVRSISPPKPAQSSFRPSMRSSSPEPVKSSRFSIRSLSPAGRFRKKPKDVPPVPSLPSPRSMPEPKGKAPAPAPAKSRAFQSRFADSSDEDEERPRRFASRFADSDSEPEPYELPPGLAPVRGIPRKAGEEDGDSTDLEEEMEASKPSTSAPPITDVPNGHANGAVTTQGTALAAGSLRDSKHAPSSPATKAKRGFFGMGKKKKGAVTPAPAPAQTSQAPQPTSPTPDVPLPPQQRNREVGGPLTPIGEDDDKQLSASPAVTASPQVKQSPRSPKLQRRSTPDWPLAPPPPVTGEQRPMSSDGAARRPRFGKRQSSQFSTATTATSPVLDAQGRSVSFGRTGKKKKFQGLRRAFGINN
ncbi:uncharacterized protein M421DRAFT_417693 [Didymella exigua CBS 183.55]|uniref:Uncharacterized protein n=1 Tax=Didymella exigua CBS 183.55 TaxID=1150837 RepID=A0A6A5RU22_9PLEO|nr:uncharacterized protein M421DRAFT_417693 [Didymella exigua CBS 183.55]KAF1931965.1 hypothetical protein M421DRAFT_417693 [Didymella exigua CBS 183.55]